MNKNELDFIVQLREVCVEAVKYVGQANYQTRENHAIKQVRNSFNAFLNKEYDKIKFNNYVEKNPW